MTMNDNAFRWNMFIWAFAGFVIWVTASSPWWLLIPVFSTVQTKTITAEDEE